MGHVSVFVEVRRDSQLLLTDAMHEQRALVLAGRSKDGRPVLSVQVKHYWPKLVDDNVQIVYFFTVRV